MVEIGSGVLSGGRVKYANIHETGGQAGRNRLVTIPARRYLSRSLQSAKPRAIEVIEQQIDIALRR
jgi:phage gpG-like protein